MTEYNELIKAARYCSEADITECEKTCESAGKGCVYHLISQCADALDELEFVCNRYEKDYKALCAYLPKWVPVTERLPKIYERVLVCRENKMIMVDAYVGENGENLFACNDGHITHWMSLPTPPKEET